MARRLSTMTYIRFTGDIANEPANQQKAIANAMAALQIDLKYYMQVRNAQT